MTPSLLSDEERRRRLGVRHRLTPSTRSDDVAQIAESVVALHSTDPVSVYLSVLARMRTPSLEAVSRALYADRSVVRHHAMRRTLWVGGPTTVGTMHHACTLKIASAERRRSEAFLAQSGIRDPEVWLAEAKQQVMTLLEGQGHLNSRQIGLALPELARPLAMAVGKPYAATQGAHSRVVAGLAFDGRLVRAEPLGSWVGSQYAWARVQDWSRAMHAAIADPHAEVGPAQVALARHWLSRFGPGSTRDLSWYAGWTLAETRRALAGAEAVPVHVREGEAWVLPEDAEPLSSGPGAAGDEEPWVALLPGLDPTVMGWKERGFYLPPEAGAAWDSYGNAGPTVWVDGVVVGAWAQRSDGEIRVHYFRPVPVARRAEVNERAAQMADWLADTRISWRFPGAINSTILGPP